MLYLLFIVICIFIIIIGAIIFHLFQIIDENKYREYILLVIGVSFLCLSLFVLPKYKSFLGISEVEIRAIQLLFVISIVFIPLKRINAGKC